MPNPPMLTGVTQVPVGGLNAVGTQANPQMPSLSSGTVLSGVVLGVDPRGNPVIQTSGLQLVLSTPYPLPKNAQISLRLEQAVSKDFLPSVRILTVDTKPTIMPPNLSQTPSASNTELAKPVGIVLQLETRSTEGSVSLPTQAQPSTPQTPEKAPQARNIATQLVLSQQNPSLLALLVRPANTPKATQILQELGQFLAPNLPKAAHAQSLPSQPPPVLLTTGLQVQLKIVTVLPTLTPPTTSAPPLLLTPPPVSASVKSAYAAYGGKVPVPITAPSLQNTLPQNILPQTVTTQKQTPLPQQALPQALTPAIIVPPLPEHSREEHSSLPTNTTTQIPVEPIMAEDLLNTTEKQLAKPNQMAALVVGKEASGALMLHTRLGILSVPAEHAPAVANGAVLVVEVENITSSSSDTQIMPTAMALPAQLAQALQSASPSSALNMLISVLVSAQNTSAADVIQRIAPHIGGGLTAGMVLFSSLLKRGSLNEWLGNDLIEQLKQLGKGELLQRLNADFMAMQHVAQDSPASNWQAVFFPVMVDQTLQQARLFVKPDDDNKKAQGGGTRFMVEVDLSQLGRMQMDGLIKKRDMQSFFDLVIRTIQPLPEEMQHDITSIFSRAQEATGIGGNLYFRRVSEFPVNPLHEMAVHTSRAADGAIIV